MPQSYAPRAAGAGRFAPPRAPDAGDHARLFADFAEALARLAAGAPAAASAEPHRKRRSR